MSLYTSPFPKSSSSVQSNWGTHIGRILLFAVPVMNLLWTPLVTVHAGRAANVVPMDVLIILGWIVALLTAALRRSEMSKMEKLAWQIVILANAPLLLSPFASFFVSGGRDLLPGLITHLKRIGLASILVPLAVQCQLAEIKRVLVYPLLIAAAFLYFGPPGWLNLPVLSFVAPSARSGREVSLLFNPNVLGYATSIHILLLIMCMQMELSVLVKLGALAGIVVTLLAFASGASRSATIALVAALLYIVWKYRSPRMFAVLWIMFLALWIRGLFALDLIASGYFAENILVTRWLKFVNLGVNAPNVAGRMVAQHRVVQKCLQVPFGTGIGTVATDSIYIDYLGAMGFVGLASVLLLLGKCWQGQHPQNIEGIAGRAVLICAAIFSAGSLGIAANFVSPLFFTAVGLGMSSGLNESAERDVMDHNASKSALTPSAPRSNLYRRANK